MAKLLKLRRGTTSQHSSFTGAEGEVTVDTDKDVLVVHDGSTAGGHAMAAQDMDNVPAGSILGTQLENSGVTAGQYGSSSAIPIVTVDAQGLVTAASTTAIDSTTIANGSASVAVSNNGPITSNANHDFSAGIDVTGNINCTGNIDLEDASSVKLGTDDDFQLSYDNGNNQALISMATGKRLKLKCDSIHINNAADSSNILLGDDTGSVTLFHGTSAKFQTTSSGIKVTGTITGEDNHGLLLGTGQDLRIRHTGNHSEITDEGTGDLRLGSNRTVIMDAGLNEVQARFIQDGAVELYHGMSGSASEKKIETTSTGVDVTGNITVSGTVDGRDVASDGTLLDGLTSSTGVLKSSVTVATQPQSNNSTKVATTAYVRTAISEAQAFPSGTKMLFQQTNAPTGWTKQTSGVDNKALRVVSGTAGSGGTNAFSNTLADRSITANSGNATAGGNISVANTTAGGNVNISSVSTSGTVNSHTLTINQIPSHSHNYGMQQRRGNNTNYRNNAAGLTDTSYIGSGTRNYTHAGNAPSSSAGGGGGHSHGFTGSSHNHNGSLSGTAHTHNATFTGSAHNHSISVTNLDMAVQYLDVIIAAKD